MRTQVRKTGKVYLVGAGPGDPGLLTIRGKECLAQADVVLYDNLANPWLLHYAPEHAERIYVGRRGRGGYAHQDEINKLLLEKVREGKTVVRLKGGDPFVFGRGGEEAEVVADAGVAFEVVPGVTSAVAVPAYAGIPVTHRTLASTVTFVTGHEDPSREGTRMEWPRLATVDGTLVFLMGMKNLPMIVEQLIQEGKAPDTPVAAIRWGTYPRQKTVTGTLDTIVALANAAALEPPTVIVIGAVVNLRERLNWFESRPLFGKHILVTRAQAQAADLSDLIVAYGGEPVECPALQFVPPDSWEPVDEAMAHLASYQWIVFTSVNGVQWFMRRLRQRGLDARALHGAKVCAIGPRTADELSQFGVTADLVPAEFQAEGVIDALSTVGISGQRVLIPRAEQAREILPEQLRGLGATVNVITVYRTIAPDLDAQTIKERLRNKEIHAVTFASSSTVRNFCNLFESSDQRDALLGETLIACIGPITAETVREMGLQVGLVAAENTIPALVEALANHFRQTK